VIDYEDKYDPETIAGTDLPPKLEEFLPKEFYPGILRVHDCNNCAFGDAPSSGKNDSQKRHHVDTSKVYRYKRVFPVPESSSSSNQARVASLHLRPSYLHGVGHHSSAYRAPFTLPEPLSTNSRSQNGQVTVIAKMAFFNTGDRKALEHEAQIMDTFSSEKYRHMQQEWCGLNVIRGLLNPVPVGAVVPKFYGYYVPDDEPKDKRLSPIMLIEDCGVPVHPKDLSNDKR
jgi:hypothetical protein